MITSEYFCRKMFARMFFASGISGLALALSNIIDAVCVGSVIGETGLAAIGIVSPVYIIFNVIGYGFSVGGSVVFSRLLSDGREEEAVDHFNEMLLMLLTVSILFALLGNVFLDQLMLLLGAGDLSGTLFGLCRDYAKIIITAMPVFMLNFMCNDFLRCDDDQYRATAAFVTGAALDFVLNLLFICVLDFGIKGAAYSTVIAQLVSVLIAMPHFFQKDKALKFRLVKWDLSRCLKSLKTGISTSIESLFLFIFLLTSNQLLMNGRESDGELYVAVFDVIMNISYITSSMFIAAGETLRPLASTFYAEHNSSLSRYALRMSLIGGYILNTVIIGGIALFADKFSMLFGIKTAEGLTLSVNAVRIFCIGALISGVAMILSAFYQSTEQERRAMNITMLRTFLFLLPITVISCVLNVALFWYAMPAAEILTFLIILVLLLKRRSAADEGVYFSYMLCKAENIGEALQRTEAFCEQQGISMKQTNIAIMFIEETCGAIIQNAFCGDKDEYIQITAAVEQNGEFVLHVRDSAVTFNPFDMKTKRLGGDTDDSYLNSVGILMMKNKAKDFYYRRYQGFNMLTIKFNGE